jgi:tetraprenyl-beta-curcumene synthase
VFGDGSLTARAGLALLRANARYWPTVAPTVREQLRHWELRAQAIPDPDLRRVALENLHTESFNAEATTTLATLVNRADRARTAEAIVAMQVMYDYLDGLAEQTTFDVARDGHRLFAAFTDAVTPHVQPRNYYGEHSYGDDGHYLSELTATVKYTLAALPASTAIAPVAQRAARRCAEAQTRVHAPVDIGPSELEAWAVREAAGTPLPWREFLAGAATSAMSVFALITAGADRQTTREQALAIDAAYLSIGALATMLDSLIDFEHDVDMDMQWYLRCYEDQTLLAARLAEIARLATAQARGLPHDAHHVMTLVGTAAYYLSAPEANSELARPLTNRLRKELRPLITPTLAVMRTWRAAKGTRGCALQGRRLREACRRR